MGYLVLSAGEHDFAPPSWRPTDPRQVIEVPRGFLAHSQANLWRFPPSTGGRRHVEPLQEEIFCVVEGTLTAFLGDPAERFELSPQSVIVVQPGTPLQLRNDGETDLVFFAYGAPSQDPSYKADVLPDAVA